MLQFSMGDKMIKFAFSIPVAAVVAVAGGLVLVPGVASAATAGPAFLAYSSSPAAGDPDTTVTFEVTTGDLSMTAPGSAELGGGAPGSTITGGLGDVTVTDDRALLDASWTVNVSAGNWSTGGGTLNERILAGDVTYNPGDISTTGTITATGTPVTLSNGGSNVIAGTDGVGNNTASWDPAISVAVPASAVGGTYSGIITQSVF
jgi:hypothetical protein